MIDRMQIPAPAQGPSRKPRQAPSAKPNGQAGFQEMVQKVAPTQSAPTPKGGIQSKDPTRSADLQVIPEKMPTPAIAQQRFETVSPAIPQVVELHLDVQSGDREIVTLPWTLVANGVFGESLGQASHAVDNPGLGLRSMVTEGVEPRAAMLADGLPEEEALSNTTSCESASGQAQGMASTQRQELESREHIRVDRQPASALASGHWQKKLLRILEKRSEGRAAVYYRDYSMTHDDLDRVTAHLRDLAEHAGTSIHRVVINGTEIWSSSMQGGT
ncbi:hypothetical protein [Solilutibacter silvestris]|uniref:hypothetical protein n=1 Tax=Solilutibacter silvestris TaxID=1645665 RepID=UPI003D342ADE